MAGTRAAPAEHTRRTGGAVQVMVTAGAVAAAVLLGTTACAPAGTVSAANATAGVTASATTSTPDAVLSATPASPVPPTSVAPTSAAPVPQAQQWRTFSSAGGKVSFDYPAQWTVAAPPGASGSSAVDVDVTDAEGMVVASLHYGPSGGIGGACQGPVPYTVLDSVELALPYNTSAADTITRRFAFRALQEADRVTASYGITSSVAGKDGKSCMFYNVVSGPAESPLYSFADAFQVNAGGSEQNGNRKGAKSFPSLEEARAYMRSSEYLNAKRMITSLKINAG